MNRINLLDESTINKIAAGEVIERPASIIKELIENSIDAKSTSIIVEIKNGGKDLIRVADNGTGIHKDDINKAFLRHATSKINRAEDLDSLFSLGFRGEALASIAAVSRLMMKTRTEEEAIATEIRLEGGKVVEKQPTSSNRGTQIEVRDLFFNTPARRKFLKSNQSETMAITDLVNKMCIGNPSVRIKYINNGKTVFETMGDGSLFNVIRLLYGKDISDNLINLDYSCPLFNVEGYIGNNNIYRSNRNLQHIYINGRYVKSPNITKAVNDAYRALIPINKYPVCFINIDIDPGDIDVNIHPNKLEVKFGKEDIFISELTDFLRGSLLKSSLVGRYKSGEKDDEDKFSVGKKGELSSFGSFSFTKDEQKQNEKNVWREIFNMDKEEVFDFSKEKESPQMIKETGHTDIKDELKQDGFKDNEQSTDLSEFKKTSSFLKLSDIQRDENTTAISEDIRMESTLEQMEFEVHEKKRHPEFEKLKFTGIVFDTYIIFEKDDSMFMLDQHAAHERVRFEMYMNRYRSRTISMQMLVEPIIMELSVNDMELTVKNLDVFRRFGFDVEEFGHRNISVRGLPNMFGRPESEKFIYEIIDNLGKMDSIYDARYDDIAEIACKSAIKGNDVISMQEAIELVNQLSECENPFTCPHGRPVMVKLTKYEIEKMFKRKM